MTHDIKRGPHMDDCPGMGGCSEPTESTESERLAEFVAQMVRVEYDPVCHCGTPLSSHSAYDNHSFTEMDTHESMAAKLKNAHHAIHTLRAALRPLASSGISIEDVSRAQVAMMETEGFPFDDSYLPLVLESLPPKTRCICAHDDRYECMRLRSAPQIADVLRECCECACHDDYEAACNQESDDV